MIISSLNEYNILLERMNRDENILTPIFRDPYYHRMENSILCVGITFTDNETYIVSISHDDAPTFEIPRGSKTFSNKQIEILAYITNTPIPRKEYELYITSTYNQFGMYKDTNKLIPITVWSRYIKQYHTQLLGVLNAQYSHLTDPSFIFVNTLSETLQEIESAGLKVDMPLFVDYYDNKVDRYFKNDMLYTEYNLFTTTGRPSNKFGGINFSALNKSDGGREMFISRYPDGVLVQFDFEAYHLRLVANEYGFELPTGSLHTELAKKYFDTDDITDELYVASKQKTFEIMYGMSDETYGIPLFEQIVNLRQIFKDVIGPMILPSGIQVDVKENTASKKFNYHIQSLEIVKTLPKLRTVLELLKDTNHCLILYTYDSILLDMQSFDKEVITQIKNILEENKKFPVRIHMGTNYNNISEIRL